MNTSEATVYLARAEARRMRAVRCASAAEECAEEFAGIGPDWARLRRLAALSGGRVVSPAELSAASSLTLGSAYGSGRERPR